MCLTAFLTEKTATAVPDGGEGEKHRGWLLGRSSRILAYPPRHLVTNVLVSNQSLLKELIGQHAQGGTNPQGVTTRHATSDPTGGMGASIAAQRGIVGLQRGRSFQRAFTEVWKRV